jgi:hypothetical protein
LILTDRTVKVASSLKTADNGGGNGKNGLRTEKNSYRSG